MPTRTRTAPAAHRILDAADRLLARYGYRKMTVGDLAREAGIGKGTVYLSFASKSEIALACIERMARPTGIDWRTRHAPLSIHVLRLCKFG